MGGLLNLYLILIAVYVRRRQNRGDIHCPSYIPHPGYLLFIDMSVMGGCFAWGGLTFTFSVLGEDALSSVYTFGLILVGSVHCKDCWRLS
jgi:hypothetical protein